MRRNPYVGYGAFLACSNGVRNSGYRDLARLRTPPPVETLRGFPGTIVGMVTLMPQNMPQNRPSPPSARPLGAALCWARWRVGVCFEGHWR